MEWFKSPFCAFSVKQLRQLECVYMQELLEIVSSTSVKTLVNFIAQVLNSPVLLELLSHTFKVIATLF